MQDPLLFLLSEISATFRARLTAHTEETVPELTPFLVRLITMIGRNPGASQQDVARMMDRDKAQIARAVKDLEGRGLIRRKIAAEDGRRQRVELTAPGTEIFRGAESYRHALAAEMLQDLSDPDRAATEATLTTLLTRLKNS